MKSVYALPKTASERRDFISTMSPETHDLLVDLYGTANKFINSKNRVEPLESWIMLYDRTMGFLPDALDLLSDMNMASADEDPRVGLYFILENKVLKYLKR